MNICGFCTEGSGIRPLFLYGKGGHTAYPFTSIYEKMFKVMKAKHILNVDAQAQIAHLLMQSTRKEE